MAEQQEWFATNAPKPQAGDDWFAANAAQKHESAGATTNADLLRMRSGVRPEMTEGELTSPSFVDQLSERMRGPAHPGTVGEVLTSLLVPEMPMAIANGARTVAANLKGTLSGGKLLSAPGRVIGRVIDRFNDPLTIGERTFRDAPLYKQMEALPSYAEGPITAGGRVPDPPMPTTPSGSHLDLSVPKRPSELTQAELGERIKFGTGTASPIQRNGMGRPIKPNQGVLRVKAQEQPVTIDEAAAAAVPDQLPMTTPRTIAPAADPMQAAIDAKRADIGSQAMGREFQTGPGKTAAQAGQDVRDLATARGGVTQGDASPVLPQQPFNRVFDTMKGMAPDARPGYVDAAKDPKTFSQLETIRRSLERLGLTFGSAAVVREALRNRLIQGGASTDPQ